MSDEARRPGESFLAHRARLKATRQRAGTPPGQLPMAHAQPDPEPEPPVVEPPRQLTDADMPPLDSLTAESDFSQFLAEGVSDALRRAALRKLFHLPEFGVLDGLNDYDEDYTQFEKLGEVVTRYQRRLRAREAEQEAAAERDAAVAAEGRGARTDEPPEAPPETDADSVARPACGEAADAPFDDDGDLQA